MTSRFGQAERDLLESSSDEGSSPVNPREAEIVAGTEDRESASRYARPISLPRSHLPDTDISFSMSALHTARVIGQVDRKFVACVVESDHTAIRPSQNVLVIIDQHAADERVSVERILGELCVGFLDHKVETVDLNVTKPTVLLSREEATMLIKPGVIDVFARWGIRLDLSNATEEDEFVQVNVTAVPESLVARLRTREAREMTRLIKLYLPVVDSHKEELDSLVRRSADGQVDWGRALRFMPREMLELANSKACRRMSTLR